MNEHEMRGVEPRPLTVGELRTRLGNLPAENEVFIVWLGNTEDDAPLVDLYTPFEAGSTNLVVHSGAVKADSFHPKPN
jgi:hypothetical protein